MSATPKVYVVDELVAKPGDGRVLLDAYMADYAPGARARGMTLEQVLVSPPLWADELEHTAVRGCTHVQHRFRRFLQFRLDRVGHRVIVLRSKIFS